jgi:anti-anti-sigma factor
MTVQKHVDHQNRTVTLSINGDFRFDIHPHFTSAYKSIKEFDYHWTVDLSRVGYMDSSALGMLLVFKEHTRGNGKNITLKGANQTVSDVLKIANFHQIFNI